MMVLTYVYHIFSRGVVSKPPPLLPNVFINNLSIVNPYLKPYCTGGGGGYHYGLFTMSWLRCPPIMGQTPNSRRRIWMGDWNMWKHYRPHRKSILLLSPPHNMSSMTCQPFTLLLHMFLWKEQDSWCWWKIYSTILIGFRSSTLRFMEEGLQGIFFPVQPYIGHGFSLQSKWYYHH